MDGSVGYEYRHPPTWGRGLKSTGEDFMAHTTLVTPNAGCGLKYGCIVCTVANFQSPQRGGVDRNITDVNAELEAIESPLLGGVG